MTTRAGDDRDRRRVAAVRRCPICGKVAAELYRPFCSKRCADLDLGRWLRGGYSVPSEEAPTEDELHDPRSEDERD